ncbi:hypothetical protein APA_606 [Pseudanabaena sp. lw0831]|nr:hypothetical protein APA_606 [Pseudanabaena sp. lw0831]
MIVRIASIFAQTLMDRFNFSIPFNYILLIQNLFLHQRDL